MSRATQLITEELSYLRSMHEEAVKQTCSIIANSIGQDIADLVAALEVIDRLEAERGQATSEQPDAKAA